MAWNLSYWGESRAVNTGTGHSTLQNCFTVTEMHGPRRWWPFKLETIHCLSRGKSLKGCHMQMESNVLHHRERHKVRILSVAKSKGQMAHCSSGPTEVEKNVWSKEDWEMWCWECSRSRAGWSKGECSMNLGDAWPHASQVQDIVWGNKTKSYVSS